MPDMTLCDNKDCPLKDSCYRSLAEPDKKYQSYASFEYEKNRCEYYINVNIKGE